MFVEIVMAFGLFALVSVPLLRSFESGTAQTRLVRSHVVARGLAEWALARARSLVRAGAYEGLACPAGATPLSREDLTSEATGELPSVASELAGLEVVREVRCADVGSNSPRRLYRVDVVVRWTDRGQAGTKELRLAGVAGEEV